MLQAGKLLMRVAERDLYKLVHEFEFEIPLPKPNEDRSDATPLPKVDVKTRIQEWKNSKKLSDKYKVDVRGTVFLLHLMHILNYYR